jgi:beta-phosphoglucomutase
MPTWPRAVFFDFDGVIVNSEPLHFQAFKEVLASECIALDEEEYYRELIGFDDKGAFRHLYQKRGLALAPKTFLSLMARKSEAMMDLIDRGQFSALPGVEEFVRSLWRTCPLAICSGALREEIEAMLEAVCLRDCFGVIVAAQDVAVGKPDPSGYLKTMQLVSDRMKGPNVKPLKPADCLIIEDAPTVIRSVKAHGFPVIGVATSYPLDRLTDADFAVKTLRPEEVRQKVPQLAV